MKQLIEIWLLTNILERRPLPTISLPPSSVHRPVRARHFPLSPDSHPGEQHPLRLEERRRRASPRDG